MKLAFIGIGNVGGALAAQLHRKGHTVIIAHNNPESDSVKKALEQLPQCEVMNIQQAVTAAEVVFLATPFKVAGDVLKGIQFNGKVLVDCTNPVGPGISHGLNSVRSGSEQIQEMLPDAQVVKAFTIYGFENFVNSEYPAYNVKPVMLIAGNSGEAKKSVAKLVEDTGFMCKDTGPLDQALHLEHMTLLWVKMVRRGQHSPGMVWAALER